MSIEESKSGIESDVDVSAPDLPRLTEEQARRRDGILVQRGMSRNRDSGQRLATAQAGLEAAVRRAELGAAQVSPEPEASDADLLWHPTADTKAKPVDPYGQSDADEDLAA